MRWRRRRWTQYIEHYRTWLGFTRLIKYVLVFLVILLLTGMGYFLT